MTENENNFMETAKGIGGAIIIFVVLGLLICCSGCRFFKELEQTKNDTTEKAVSDSGSVRKHEVESKKDSEFEKTTFIPVFPPKDTSIINNYFPDQKPSYIVIQEKGKSSEESKEVIVDTTWKKDLRELEQRLMTKETTTDIKAGPSLLEWILIAGLGLLLIKNFLPFKIIKT